MMTIDLGDVRLEAHVRVPEEAGKLALFVHGSGSSRHSPRNNHVAEQLERRGIASLLFDLLTEEEDRSRETRFDIDLLTRRVTSVLGRLADIDSLARLEVHLFGASTGAAAAIRAAAAAADATPGGATGEVSTPTIRSVVSRGGRPDLAGDALAALATPCLLIVGGNDPQVLQMNRDAQSRMSCENELRIVEGASHLFEEPGALDEVARYAAEWITTH